MAKRKRLSPATLTGPAPITPDGNAVARPLAAPPIANVAGDAATVAALTEVTEELAQARQSGRMVLEIPLDEIDANYLVRDRTFADDEDMAALIESIRERGQQTPIEVTKLPSGRYGLISGWRRLTAIKQLRSQSRDNSLYSTALALLRQPQDASDAYQAMVEENEIRVGLSFYERARIVSKAVEQGVFETDKAGLQSLFRSASRAKRSKIKSFLPIVRRLEGVLHYPESLGERLGLLVSKQLEEDAYFVERVRGVLETKPASFEVEQRLIQKLMTPASSPTPEAKPKQADRQRLATGLDVEIRGDGAVIVSGPAVTPALQEALRDWLKGQITQD